MESSERFLVEWWERGNGNGKVDGGFVTPAIRGGI